jgi:hypothetical protein
MQNGDGARMGRALLMTALGAGVVGSVASATEPAATALDLVWVDLAAMGPTMVKQTSGEVRDLLAPLGVRVTSRIEAPVLAFRPGQAAVILLQRSQNVAHTGSPVAGSVTPGDPNHTAWVNPALVADGLGLALERWPSWTLLKRRAFARALAAVVAHELAHSLAGASHAPGGIMAETLRPGLLCNRHLAMDPQLAPGFQVAMAAEPSPGLP